MGKNTLVNIIILKAMKGAKTAVVQCGVLNSVNYSAKRYLICSRKLLSTLKGSVCKVLPVKTALNFREMSLDLPS